MNDQQICQFRGGASTPNSTSFVCDTPQWICPSFHADLLSSFSSATSLYQPNMLSTLTMLIFLPKCLTSSYLSLSISFCNQSGLKNILSVLWRKLQVSTSYFSYIKIYEAFTLTRLLKAIIKFSVKITTFTFHFKINKIFKIDYWIRIQRTSKILQEY